MPDLRKQGFKTWINMTTEKFLQLVLKHPVVISAEEHKGYIKIRYKTGSGYFPAHREDKMLEALEFCENYKY